MNTGSVMVRTLVNWSNGPLKTPTCASLPLNKAEPLVEGCAEEPQELKLQCVRHRGLRPLDSMTILRQLSCSLTHTGAPL